MNFEQTFFYQSNDKGINSHNTVSNGPDNGANNYMAKGFWKCMRHSTTEQAVNNWLTRVKIETEEEKGTNNLNIGGHGNEGFLETGSGQTGTADRKKNYINRWNGIYWNPFLSQLEPKNFVMLYIYSCHTGAGYAGANLLFKLAQAIGKPVAGRTGFTYSNSNGKIWFEKGSVWQVATPDLEPTPIEAPTPHFTKKSKIELSDGKKVFEVSKTQVKSISISKNLGVNSRAIELDKEIYNEFSLDFFSSGIFSAEGNISAKITAELKMTVEIDGNELDFSFSVLNNRILADKFNNFYYMSREAQLLIETAE